MQWKITSIGTDIIELKGEAEGVLERTWVRTKAIDEVRISKRGADVSHIFLRGGVGDIYYEIHESCVAEAEAVASLISNESMFSGKHLMRLAMDAFLKVSFEIGHHAHTHHKARKTKAA